MLNLETFLDSAFQKQDFEISKGINAIFLIESSEKTYL